MVSWLWHLALFFVPCKLQARAWGAETMHRPGRGRVISMSPETERASKARTERIWRLARIACCRVVAGRRVGPRWLHDV